MLESLIPEAQSFNHFPGFKLVLNCCHSRRVLNAKFPDAVSLVGQSAAPEVLQKLTYLVIRHPQIKRIDTVRAYTFGVLYFVEVSP